jgi:hypothetical protein
MYLSHERPFATYSVTARNCVIRRVWATKVFYESLMLQEYSIARGGGWGRKNWARAGVLWTELTWSASRHIIWLCYAQNITVPRVQWFVVSFFFQLPRFLQRTRSGWEGCLMWDSVLAQLRVNRLSWKYGMLCFWRSFRFMKIKMLINSWWKKKYEFKERCPVGCCGFECDFVLFVHLIVLLVLSLHGHVSVHHRIQDLYKVNLAWSLNFKHFLDHPGTSQ